MWPQPEYSDCVSQKVKGQRLAPEPALVNVNLPGLV